MGQDAVPVLPRLAVMVEAHRAAAEAVACSRCLLLQAFLSCSIADSITFYTRISVLVVCFLHSTREDETSVSVECAASLARTALAWLQPEAVQGLIRLCSRARPRDETPMLAAQAALCALAAALRLLWAATQHPGLASARTVLPAGPAFTLCCKPVGMHAGFTGVLCMQDGSSIADEVGAALSGGVQEAAGASCFASLASALATLLLGTHEDQVGARCQG